MNEPTSERLTALPSESLLGEKLPKFSGTSALVISPGRAQLAEQLLNLGQYQQASAWYLDLFSAATTASCIDPRVEVLCSADLPDQSYDLVAMPVLTKSESELTRDLMQQAHARLVLGGYLAMAVNHAGDQWVHQQMQVMFPKVSCNRSMAGCVYWAQKHDELKKVKSFQAEFSFRDDEHLIRAVSRPGVFAHRRVDVGARQLMRSAEIGPQDHVLDMGCGSGTISLAAGKRTGGLVHAVDSNARAIECLKRSAEWNQLNNVCCHLNADGELDLSQPVDVALANPPYYGDDTIACHFVDVCIKNLRTGGALLVVTKQPRWYHAYFQSKLEEIAIFESSSYFVCCGRKP